MGEQNHANARTELIAAICFAVPSYSTEDAERLVGALAEFVRDIILEEVRPGNLRLGVIGPDGKLGPNPH